MRRVNGVVMAMHDGEPYVANDIIIHSQREHSMSGTLAYSSTTAVLLPVAYIHSMRLYSV